MSTDLALTNTAQLGHSIGLRRRKQGKLQPGITLEILDPERLTRTQTIRAGNVEGASRNAVNDGVIDVALRFADDGSCFGATNESYYHRWRPPDWKLQSEKYLIDVEITAANGQCKGFYYLDLGGHSAGDISIREASEEEEGKILRPKPSSGG